MPTVWRVPKEIAGGGDRRCRKLTAAVSRARRHCWAQVIARHGALPPVRLADRALEGEDLHPAGCHRHCRVFG